MAVQYASGKNALAICDRCGRTCKYSELQYQVFNLQNTQLKVCRECLDKDQPQLQVGRTPTDDPQALLLPRPDTGIGGNEISNSRWLFSWNPAGSNIFPGFAQLGRVTAKGA